jgi:hypothetical protein
MPGPWPCRIVPGGWQLRTSGTAGPRTGPGLPGPSAGLGLAGTRAWLELAWPHAEHNLVWPSRVNGQQVCSGQSHSGSWPGNVRTLPGIAVRRGGPCSRPGRVDPRNLRAPDRDVMCRPSCLAGHCRVMCSGWSCLDTGRAVQRGAQRSAVPGSGTIPWQGSSLRLWPGLDGSWAMSSGSCRARGRSM